MSDKSKIRKIAIAGAGLVGSLASLFLVKRGYQVTVFERRPDPRKSQLKGGKSINLALSNRGWLPLNKAGIIKKVEEMIIPMKGRMMHSIDSELTFQPYGKSDQAINSISRSGLNELLMDEAESNGARIEFETQCLHVDINDTSLTVLSSEGTKQLNFDLILGADGAFSSVRSALQKTDRFDFSQYYIPHGYKELSIPPGASGEFLLEKNALHIWPRGSFMLIALPNLDASFTVTLFLAFEGKHSFEKLNSMSEVREFFDFQFPDAVPVLTSLDQEWLSNPTSSLVTIKTYPWHKNKTLLIGDAAHAIVPFYGQGMNCGFEDCRVLNDMLDHYEDDWTKLLPAFQESRKPDADAIADLALQNFVEMRDLVANEEFLLRKKIESKIHELFPDQWTPLYSMVTFNEAIRYSDALDIGKKQLKIMDQVMASKNIAEEWESLDFQGIVDKLSD